MLEVQRTSSNSFASLGAAAAAVRLSAGGPNQTIGLPKRNSEIMLEVQRTSSNSFASLGVAAAAVRLSQPASLTAPQHGPGSVSISHNSSPNGKKSPSNGKSIYGHPPLPPPTRESVLQRLSEALLRRSLAKIDLSQKGLQPQDARLVKMALLQNRQLRVLKLGYNQLGDVGLQTLVAGIAQHAQLQSLDLGFNNIGDVGCQALAAAMPPQLSTLYLAGNCIGQDGAMSLADVLRRGGLQRLYMTGNRLGPDGVKALTEAILEEAASKSSDNNEAMTPTPSKPGMQELFLGGTGLGASGCQAIARLLASPDCRLKVLSLANCDLTDEEILRGLAPSIKGNRDNLPLTSLQLSFNAITHKGLEALMNALWGSRTLKELRIDNNDIGDRGAQQLAAILPYLKTLETLDVGFNTINNKSQGMKILMKAVAETNHLVSLSLSGNPLQDVSSAKAVAYALAYNTSLQSLGLVHCHLTTEGQRHVAAGAVSNSRTSLRELSGFPVGPVIVTLGFPDALEHWTNEQVLNFIHLMWNSAAGYKEEHADPLNFLPSTGRHKGPLEATIVVDVARKAFASLVANGVDVFSRRAGHSRPAVMTPRDAIMLESVDGDAIIESMGIEGVVPEHPKSPPAAKQAARSFVAPPVPQEPKHLMPDPSRKKRIVEWLCSNIKHLNKMAQVPFDSSELLRLHQHYFTPVVNESGGSSAYNGMRPTGSAPTVGPPMEDASVSSSMQSGDVNNMVPASDPMFSNSAGTPAVSQSQHQGSPSGLPHAAVASSLPMLKRKVSYRFLGDATLHASPPPPPVSTWGFSSSNNANTSVAKMIQDGPSGHTLPPKNKKARRNRTRISFLPRIRAKLDSYLDVCHEKALITMRQLYYVEQAILSGSVNPLQDLGRPSHLSGALATDAETIVVDMM